MGKLKSKNIPQAYAEFVEEVFLIEAVGRFCAKDIPHPEKSQILLRQGDVINPQRISELASTGIDRVPVYRKPNISILVIGNGVIPPGTALSPGKTYDANTPLLQAALSSMQIRPVFIRRLHRETKTLRKLVSFALNQSDILLLILKEKDKYNLQTVQQLINRENVKIIFPKENGIKNALPFSHQKMVFCLPFDSRLIFKYFIEDIQLAIQSFMGYRLRY